MVTRSAAVKFGPRSIDNYQGYLCLYCNQRENNETLSDAGPRPPTFWTFGYGCAHKKLRIETKWRCQVALGRGKEPSASAEGGSRQDVTRQDASRQEVADHIASMLESMRRLAHQKDMSLLYFLIGAAVEEANAEKASRA